MMKVMKDSLMIRIILRVGLFELHLLERGLLQSDPSKLCDDRPEEELLLHGRTPEHKHRHHHRHANESTILGCDQSETLT